MTRHLLRPTIAAAAVAFLLGACSSGDAADDGTAAAGEFDLVSAGTLTVCTDSPYPPFEFEDPNAPSGYSGFDVEVTRAIAEELGLDFEVKDVSFDALQSGTVLAAGQCDMGMSAITITEERKANLDFADPYYDSLQSLLTRSDSGIASIDDLAGKRLGVQQGTTGQNYAEENAPEGTTFVEYPSDGELWPALQADQIDAILQDLPVNVEHVKADADYAIVGEYETGEQYGFAFAKDERVSLREAVNDALAAMQEDGRYQEIYDFYFAVED
ncbi:MAG: ABC transporter substrate-binding protein [Actinomycetota bacterium]